MSLVIRVLPGNAMRTLPEVLDLLKKLDESILVELLGVSSEEIVDRFADLVEEDFDTFLYKIEDLFPTDEDSEGTES